MRLCVQALGKQTKTCHGCQDIDFTFPVFNLGRTWLSYPVFFGQPRPHWAHTPPWSLRSWRRPTSTTQRSCWMWFLSQILKCLPVEAAGSSLPPIFPLGRKREVQHLLNSLNVLSESGCFSSLTGNIVSGEFKARDLAASVAQNANQLTLIRDPWPQPTDGVGADVAGDGGFPPGLHGIFLQQR